jgi:hypothetical protein
LGNKSYQPGLICPLPASRPWLEAAKEGWIIFPAVQPTTVVAAKAFRVVSKKDYL